MTVYIEKPAVNLREELASLRNQGGYQEQQFYFDSLVTNGTFDTDTAWTKGTGWTISGGSALHTGGFSNITPAVSVGLLAGKTYRAEIVVTAKDAGLIYFYWDNTSSFYGISSTGTFYITFTAALNNSNISIGTGISNVSISQVSVFETDGTDVVHRLPKGWKPKDVFEDGLLQREGAAHDYEVVYDGFDYFVKPVVAPSATTQTCVIGVKA